MRKTKTTKTIAKKSATGITNDKTGFAERMYTARYAKKIGAVTFRIFFPVRGYKYALGYVDVPANELSKVCLLKFQTKSDANIKLTGDRKDAKHLRLSSGTSVWNDMLHERDAYMMPKFSDKQVEEAMKQKTCIDHWEDGTDHVNMGKVVDYLVGSAKKGIDLPEENIEVKYYNGQIEL